MRVLPISDAQAEAARGVTTRLRAAGIRAHLDAGHETLNYRIRQGEVQKVPYMAVIGQREMDVDAVAVRVRGTGNKQEVLPVGEFLTRVRDEVAGRQLAP